MRWTPASATSEVRRSSSSRAEALEAGRAVFRMDTVMRLEPGVLLQNLTRANAAKVKRLRWSVEEEDWFLVGCNTLILNFSIYQ